MKIKYSNLLVGLLLPLATLSAEEASLTPPNAKPGECYARERPPLPTQAAGTSRPHRKWNGQCGWHRAIAVQRRAYKFPDIAPWQLPDSRGQDLQGLFQLRQGAFPRGVTGL